MLQPYFTIDLGEKNNQNTLALLADVWEMSFCLLWIWCECGAYLE